MREYASEFGVGQEVREKEGELTVVSIHQPQYLPWLGYLDKIDKSQIFVFLDNVQFKKNEWQNRNRIKTAQGWQWLTVPVIHKFPQKIYEVEINNTVAWRKKHLQALITNYSKTPFFREHIGFFEETYDCDWHYLADINIHIIRYLTMSLGMRDKKFCRASDLKLSDGKTARLVELCEQLGGDVYLAGRSGSEYLDLAKFKEAGISVQFQDYRHPRYEQLYGDFEPCMSAVDLLFNHGSESLAILREGGWN